jgi:uncharacterized protein with HEPN domain
MYFYRNAWLDGVCMNLLAVGETVKNIDKYTHKSLLVNYPSINWQDIMRLRDVIATTILKWTSKKFLLFSATMYPHCSLSLDK